MMNTPKVLLIGLDAACFSQIDPFLADGTMAHLQQLIETGVSADLETTTPPWTPSAWPSLTTGTHPWVHGVYDFFHYTDDGDARLATARDVRTHFLWEVLSAQGRSSIVVNVPVTHPIHEFAGSLVPGYLAPEHTTCLVDGESRPMTDIDETYRIYARDTSTQADRLAEYERRIDSRVSVCEQLAAIHDWSLMMVQFQSTDAVFHTDGHDRGAVRRIYGHVDDAVGSLLDLVDDDCSVLVTSDHGIHEYSRVFYCNSWLRNQGYVSTSTDAERYSWNERTKQALIRDGESESDRDGKNANTEAEDANLGSISRAIGAITRGLNRVGITPRRAEQGLSVLGLDEYVRRHLPEKLLFDLVDASEYVDRSQSTAYCRSLSSLGIRCNVASRDPGGVIRADEFDEVRRSLVRELRSLQDPDGRHVFESVYDRHEVHGSTVANDRSAPDIVIHPTNMEWKVSDIVRERVFGETDEFSHTFEGLLVASGPGVDSLRKSSPTVVDVAPTVLHRCGVSPPDPMDGTALFAGQDGNRETATPTLSPRQFVDTDQRGEDSSVVEKRLRDMGYLE